MDSLDRFEKVLNLVEKVRGLDLLTAQIVQKINQQQVDLYKEVSSECFCDPKENSKEKSKEKEKVEKTEKVEKKVEKKVETEKEKKIETEKEKAGTTTMDGKISIENLAEYLKKAAIDMKNIKDNPPESPIPPDVLTPVNDDPLDAQLNKLRKMSAIVSEHLRIQADMHKYAATAIAETHRLSFELYKDIEKCLTSTKS